MSNLTNSISAEDLQIIQAIRVLAKKNGLTGFGDNYLPPKYTDPNYVAPDSGRGLLIMDIVLVVITSIIVVGRYYAKVFIAGGLGGDDIAIGIATVLFIGSSSMYCYATEYAGFGRHVFDLNLNDIEHLLRITYVMPILYNINVFSIKLSLLLFYRRLFGQHRRLQLLVKTLILFQAIYTFVYCAGLVFICQPVRSWWVIGMRADHCPSFLRTMAIYVSLRSISVLTDVLVLCLPMKLLWDLKIPLRQKVKLAVIFGLGVMACVAAIVRLAYLPRLLLNLDISWNVIPVAISDEFEQCLGIITASLPALTAIVAKARGSIGVGKNAGLGMDSFELSETKDSIAHRRNSGDPSTLKFDFLRLAYDPDNVTVYTRVWADRPSQDRRGVFGKIRDRAGVRKGPQVPNASIEDLVVVCGDPDSCEISKSTTVEVFVDRR